MMRLFFDKNYTIRMGEVKRICNGPMFIMEQSKWWNRIRNYFWPIEYVVGKEKEGYLFIDAHNGKKYFVDKDMVLRHDEYDKNFYELYKMTFLVPDQEVTGDVTLDQLYALLGYFGEMGEIANKFKKVIRDNDGEITSEFIDSLKDELADATYYHELIMLVFNLNKNEIYMRLFYKLVDRYHRGVIGGSGDKR